MTFITFEGGDGAGKTTLIDRLYDTLTKEGRSVIKTRAPGGTPAGQVIRSLLLNKGEIHLSARCELLLFLADRAEHVEKVIRPALSEKKIVLCDRFDDSTIAYQGVGRGFGIETIESLCSFATGSLKPRLTLYLDLDPALGMKRMSNQQKDRIEAEDLFFHQTIREAFLSLAKKDPKRLRVIDASQTKDKVFNDALKLVYESIP